jgi:3-hydroxymyristoyl/3-hydroxydecanoyl-(acyl carrier protein) dehydratase
MADKQSIFTLSEIMAIIPHRPPFLFVDEVTRFTPDKTIETRRIIRMDEPFFAGHFPGKPIMPGVLIIDALAQTSGLLLGFSKKITLQRAGAAVPPPEFFYLAASTMKFMNPSYPGDTLVMFAQKDRNFGSLYTFTVEAVVKRNAVAKGTLTLALAKGTL